MVAGRNSAEAGLQREALKISHSTLRGRSRN